MKKQLAALFAASISVSGASALAAESYPAKPIRLVVAYAPGGGNDVTARILAARLTETLGVNVLVENRPGATGIVGTEFVARSPADGYTLILADAPHAINPFVYPNVKYDPIRDFEPITLVGSTPVVFALHPKVPPTTVGEFIAYAKSQPGKIAMASGGTGTISHVAGELFQLRTGTKMNHIPYKGGGPALSDLIAGQVETMFPPAPSVAPHVRAGRLKGLAVSAAKRSPAIPDAPTFDEAGIADFRVSNWYGILAPAGTPAPVVALLNREIAAAVQHPSVRDKFVGALLEPGTTTSQEFVAFLKAEASRWSQVIKTVGIKAE